MLIYISTVVVYDFRQLLLWWLQCSKEHSFCEIISEIVVRRSLPKIYLKNHIWHQHAKITEIRLLDHNPSVFVNCHCFWFMQTSDWGLIDELLISAWYLSQLSWNSIDAIPGNVHLFKVSNTSARKRCEICSKLPIKTPERRYLWRSGIVIVSFECISYILFLYFYCWLWADKCLLQ